MMDRLIFLGTGGGGHMMFHQTRRSGGLYFEFDEAGRDFKGKKDPFKFILDPGPGALIFSHALGLRPDELNGVVLTHYHTDHSSDANALLDGMNKPFLIAEEHCIKTKNELKSKKKDEHIPCISLYHRDNVKNLHAVKHGQIIKLESVKFYAAKTKHYAPTVGYKIKTDKYTIGYVGDGAYYSGQEKFYEGCDVLILNVLVPKGMDRWKDIHMNVDDAINLVKNINDKPRLIIVQHLTALMLRSNIFRQCKLIKDATKVETIHADDFMQLNLRDLTIKKYNVKIVVR